MVNNQGQGDIDREGEQTRESTRFWRILSHRENSGIQELRKKGKHRAPGCCPGAGLRAIGPSLVRDAGGKGKSCAQSLVLCKYAFMRTTVDLPDEFFQRVKAKAALRGMKLKEFIAESLQRAHRRKHRTG